MSANPDHVFEVLKFAWEQLDRVSSGRARGVGAVAAIAIDPNDVERPLDALGLGPLRAGTWRVNGVEVPFDPSGTVFDALDGIEPAATQLLNAVNADTGRARICPRVAGGRLSLDGGGTGFFAALGIHEGTYVAAMEPGRALDRAARAIDQLAALVAGAVTPDDAATLFGESLAFGVRLDTPDGLPFRMDRLALHAAHRATPDALRAWVVGTEERLAPLEQLGALLDERL
jgi:hypothetical protein